MKGRLARGKTVDVVVSRDEKNIALEIKTGNSDVVKNIQKNLGGAFSRIIIVSLNAKSKAVILKKAKEFSHCDSPIIEILELKELLEVLQDRLQNLDYEKIKFLVLY